ncbi:MAG: hypothetical protein ACI4WS_04180 [Oscillospiraceae bacterium]
MKRLYKICSLPVECDFRFPTMTARAEKYLCDSQTPPAVSLAFSQPLINQLRSRQPDLTDDDCEIIYTAEAFYFSLLHFDGFMLHSSAVVMDGEAYLFSAPSGTGKSTHTALWLQQFGSRAQILNDDKPAIMVEQGSGTITACGTPWSGKSDLNLNLCVPLRGICILERSPENFIEPLPPEQSVFALLNQTLRPADSDRMTKLLDLLDAVTTRVPIWHMGCTISEEAAQMAYKAMSRK